MRDAVVVSTARTPTGKAYRGTLAGTQTQHLAAHALAAAVEEAGIEGGEIEYVVLGCAMQEGTSQLSTRASIRCASRKATRPRIPAGRMRDPVLGTHRNSRVSQFWPLRGP